MSLFHQKVAIVTGYDPALDRDAVGQYTELLQRYSADAASGQFDIDLVMFRPQSALKWPFGYYKAIRRYDLVHLQYPSEGWKTSPLPGIIPGLWRKTVRSPQKLVCTFHEWQAMHPLRKASVMPLALASDGMVFVSPQERAAFLDSQARRLRFSKPEISVIPIGINLKVPACQPEAIYRRRAALMNWNAVPAEFIIGYFGFIYAGKQPFKLLQTTKALHERGIKARLVLAGAFPGDHRREKREFYRQIKNLALDDYIVDLGYVENELILAETLSACNVLLQLYLDGVSARRSSFWYALELGTPLITTKPQSDQEFEGLIRLTDFNIKIVKPNVSGLEIANHTMQFKAFQLPKQQLAIAPDWEKIARQHLNLYRKLLIST